MGDMLKTKMDEIFAGAPILNFHAGEIIVHSGESPPYVYYIQSGFVRIYSLNENGQELTLHIMRPGLFFSMIWAFSNIPTHYNFEAFMSTKVLYIPKKTFFDSVKEQNQLLVELLRLNLHILDGMILKMEFLIFGQASHRVASAILFAYQSFNSIDNYNHIKPPQNLINNLPITHSTIASFAGLTRETTSLEMKKLERENIISYKRRTLVINDLETLKERSISQFK